MKNVAMQTARSLGGGGGAVLFLSSLTRLLGSILRVIRDGLGGRSCWRFDLLPLDDVENESANVARAVEFAELGVEEFRISEESVRDTPLACIQPPTMNPLI